MALTASSEDRALRLEALAAGATDFLQSPIDHDEFRVRARNLLTLRRQQLALAAHASSLEEQDRGRGAPPPGRAARKPRAADAGDRRGAGDGERHRPRRPLRLRQRVLCPPHRQARRRAHRPDADPGARRSAGARGDGARPPHRRAYRSARHVRGDHRRPRRRSPRAPDHQGVVAGSRRRLGAGGYRIARHHRPQGGRDGAGRRQGRGRAGEPQQDRVPRQHEPRAAHAA